MTLRQRAFSGFFWVALSVGAIQAIGVASSIVLHRLLLPGDFGVVEMTFVFVSLGNVLSEFGLGQTLIGRPGDVNEAADSALTVVTAFSVFCAAALYGSAPVLARLYGLPTVVPIARALSPYVLLAAAAVVPANLLERGLVFRRRTAADATSQLTSAVTSISLALAGAGVWSLVAGRLMGAAANVLVLWRFAPHRPRFGFNGAVARDLMRFGAPLMLVALATLALNRVGVAFLGRMADAAEVGFFALALMISNMTVDLTASLFGRVTFPLFSRLQGDLALVRAAYLRSIRWMTYLLFPFVALIFALVPVAVHALYGERWAPAILPARILCAYSLMRGLAALTSGLFTASGRPGITARLTVGRLALLLPLLVLLGERLGADGVGIAMGLSMTVIAVLSLGIADRHLSLGHAHVLRAILPQAAAAAAACAITTMVAEWTRASLIGLVLLGFLCASIYGALLWVGARAMLREDIRLFVMVLREAMGRATRAPSVADTY